MKELRLQRIQTGGNQKSEIVMKRSVTDRLSQMSRCPGKSDPRDLIYPENRLFKSPEVRNFDYPITGYGTVCMPDGSDKAWGMLFDSEG